MKKQWSTVASDLKTVYRTDRPGGRGGVCGLRPDLAAGCLPGDDRDWARVWPEFIPFPEFPVEIRTLIYTTNGIESLNSRFRQAVRRRGETGHVG